jgi:hypothetical protein
VKPGGDLCGSWSRALGGPSSSHGEGETAARHLHSSAHRRSPNTGLAGRRAERRRAPGTCVRGPAYPWRLAVISGFGGREKYCQNGGMAVAHHYGAPSREGRPPGVRGRHCGPEKMLSWWFDVSKRMSSCALDGE